MEGGTEIIATSNVSSSATILSGNECTYDHAVMISPLPEAIADTPAVAFLQGNNVSAVTTGLANREVRTVFSGQDEVAAGCSTSVEYFPSMETSKTDTDASIGELDYPVTGSPSADLMVVNTNGFNPLQHAALRGNPG